MASSSVRLGGFTFRGHEVPTQVPFGGHQRIAKHVLIGGRRIADAMGYEPNDPIWEGRFRGGDALSRARAVDAICQRGAAVTLSWGGLSFRVIVEKFDPDYRRATDIPYKISCYVVGTGGGGGITAGTGLDTLVGGDIGAAVGLIGATLSDPVGVAMSALTGAIGGVESLETAPLNAIGPIQNIAAQAIGTIDAAIAVADTTIMAAGTPDPALLTGPAFAGAILDQFAALQAQDATLAVRGLVGRVGVNLNTVPG